MVRMIDTPYGFEQKLSKDEFEKLGRFACRWSHIEHTVSNCLRRLLDMDPKIAQIMVFPLTLNAKMNAAYRRYCTVGHCPSGHEELAALANFDARGSRADLDLGPLPRCLSVGQNPV